MYYTFTFRNTIFSSRRKPETNYFGRIVWWYKPGVQSRQELFVKRQELFVKKQYILFKWSNERQRIFVNFQKNADTQNIFTKSSCPETNNSCPPCTPDSNTTCTYTVIHCAGWLIFVYTVHIVLDNGHGV